MEKRIFKKKKKTPVQKNFAQLNFFLLFYFSHSFRFFFNFSNFLFFSLIYIFLNIFTITGDKVSNFFFFIDEKLFK